MMSQRLIQVLLGFSPLGINPLGLFAWTFGGLGYQKLACVLGGGSMHTKGLHG